jgi:hypothetical protein
VALDGVHPARVRRGGDEGDLAPPRPFSDLVRPVGAEAILYQVDPLDEWISRALSLQEIKPGIPSLVLVLSYAQCLVVDVQTEVLVPRPFRFVIGRWNPRGGPLLEPSSHSAVRHQTHGAYLIGAENYGRVALLPGQPLYAPLLLLFELGVPALLPGLDALIAHLGLVEYHPEPLQADRVDDPFLS